MNTLRSLSKLLIGLVIFIGLPLISWGASDFSGFSENVARRAYLGLICITQLIVLLSIPNAGAGSAPDRNTVSRQKVALLLLQIVSLSLVIVAPYGDRRNFAVLDESIVIRVLGLILLVWGMGLMHWAEAILGRLFSVQVTLQEGHQLITNGPYSILRHPRYLGIILFSVGLSLTFRSWLGLILVGALALVLLWRIHDEEKLMHEEFGAEWEAYRRNTWRLIPFVY
jgi:protein-S-isoprenylcysteine O-methyltransferase Ste14